MLEVIARDAARQVLRDWGGMGKKFGGMAEDMASEAVLAMLKAGLDESTNGALLYTVAWRAASKALMKEVRADGCQISSDGIVERMFEFEGLDSRPELVSREKGPLARLIDQERLEAVMEAVEELPDPHQGVTIGLYGLKGVDPIPANLMFRVLRRSAYWMKKVKAESLDLLRGGMGIGSFEEYLDEEEA